MPYVSVVARAFDYPAAAPAVLPGTTIPIGPFDMSAQADYFDAYVQCLYRVRTWNVAIVLFATGTAERVTDVGGGVFFTENWEWDVAINESVTIDGETGALAVPVDETEFISLANYADSPSNAHWMARIPFPSPGELLGNCYLHYTASYSDARVPPVDRDLNDPARVVFNFDFARNDDLSVFKPSLVGTALYPSFNLFAAITLAPWGPTMPSPWTTDPGAFDLTSTDSSKDTASNITFAMTRAALEVPAWFDEAPGTPDLDVTQTVTTNLSMEASESVPFAY